MEESDSAAWSASGSIGRDGVDGSSNGGGTKAFSFAQVK